MRYVQDAARHETTANALSWSIFLLSGAPQVQDRARAEAKAALERVLEIAPLQGAQMA